MEVYRFEISQKELESFDWNADYILTVEASDGRTTNRKSCKVNRIRSSGYVVYIGQIKGTADGQSYYWTERNILDDPFNENAPVILDPEVTLEAQRDQLVYLYGARLEPVLRQAGAEKAGSQHRRGRPRDLYGLYH